MSFRKIKKRDGGLADFDFERIKSAVYKAFLAVELGGGDKAEVVTRDALKILEEKFKGSTPSVEDVQDAVVLVLTRDGYSKVASEYQDYRKKKEE